MDNILKIQKCYTPRFGGKEGTLSPKLSPKAISRKLGIKPSGPSFDGKSTMTWDFTVNGKRCSIWDYRGARWSCSGDREMLAALFACYEYGDKYRTA